MNCGQPYLKDKAKSRWQRKLAAGLLVVPMLWLPVKSALADITNTVVATGQSLGQTLTSSATVNVKVAPANPQISLVKTATVNDGGDGSTDPGDSISYTFTIKNTGNVTLRNVTLTDTGAILTGAPIPSMAPGDVNVVAYSALHTLVPGDFPLGKYINSATVSGTPVTMLSPPNQLSGPLPPNPPVVTATDTVQTPLAIQSSMTFKKTGTLNMGPDGRADVGDIITYQFIVTNTGKSDLHEVKISDPLVNMGSLAGNSQAIAMLEGAKQVTDNLTTASINTPRQCLAGSNFAADLTQSLTNNAVVGNLDEASLNVTRQILRMSGSGEHVAAGDKIGFVYSLSNTGNAPLVGITVDQPDAIAFNSRVELLAANETNPVSMIFTRIVTEKEIDAGQIDAPATLNAKSRIGGLILNINEPMSLASVATYDNFTTASITPTLPQTVAAGQSVTFTATYPITQPDIDAGVVNNTATATAKDAAELILTKIDKFSQPIVPAPGIATIKTGTIDLGSDYQASVNDIVTYQFAVTNTGNVTLSNVTMTDTGAIFAPVKTIATLAPGATDTTTFVATHKLTAAEVAAGQAQNQALAGAKTPNGVAITPTKTDKDADHTTLDPTIVQWPAIALIKTVSSVVDENNNGFTDKDDTIHYAFKVINTGKFTLNNIIVTDPSLPAIISGAPLNGLAPGDSNSTQFTGVYKITQNDVNLGHVDNTAKVEGTDTNNVKVVDLSDPGVPTADAPTITPILPHPVLTLVKKQSSITDKDNVVLAVGDDIIAGDIIHYTFTVTNAGNLPFKTVNVTDLLSGAVMNGATLIDFAPGATDSSTYTASYKITDNDVKLGFVSNQGKATGTLAVGGPVTDFSDNADPTQNNPTITAIKARAAIAVIKHFFSYVDSGPLVGVNDPGDVINYTFEVKNTGNVPLADVHVDDLVAGVTVVGAHITNLPAGNINSTNFTASHTLTAFDISAGKFSNTARAVGTFNTQTVTGDSDNSNFTDHNPTIITLGAGIAITKTFTGFTRPNGTALANGELVQAGYIANYAFAITNLGSGPITAITVIDPSATVTGSLDFLASGVTNIDAFTAKHTITALELAAGGIYNTATVKGTGPLGAVTDLSDPFSNYSDTPTYTPIPTQSGITLIKKMATFDDLNGSGIIDVGDVLHYEFDVHNIGNTDLVNLQLTDVNADAKIDPSPISLAAGAHNLTSFKRTHTVTVQDAKAGLFSNSATIDASVVAGGSVNDTSDPTSPTGNAPTITPVFITTPILTKVADRAEVKRGEIVTYTITASNLVPTPFELVDVMPPGFGYVAGSASINGVAINPVINARNLDFAPTMPVSGKLILKLKLMASTTLSTGKFINNAQLIAAFNGELLATAQATVTIIEESVFDCSDIIGRVFDDQNANGYMDDGEPGLPGVRVVTLNGLLITTDAEGRFHVPCAAIPDSAVGSNFLMKLDVRTLPTGYKLTTENPRDVRVTRGKVVKLNFGATINHEVRLDITGKAFIGDSLDLSDKWISGIDKLLAVLAKQHSSLKIAYHQKGEDPDLAAARVAAIEETIATAWKMGKGKYKLVTTTSVGEGK